MHSSSDGGCHRIRSGAASARHLLLSLPRFALGLAAPYLILSFQPAWTKILPRPGAWMETLKQFTSTLLFGTVIWLVWVYGHLAGTQGVDRVAWLLVSLLLVAIAGWALGKWPARWKSALGCRSHHGAGVDGSSLPAQGHDSRMAAVF